jgi:hypothetical protein
MVLCNLDPDDRVVRVSPELRLPSSVTKPGASLPPPVGPSAEISTMPHQLPDGRSNNAKSPTGDVSENGRVENSHGPTQIKQNAGGSSSTTTDTTARNKERKHHTKSKSNVDTSIISHGSSHAVTTTPVAAAQSTPVSERKSGSNIRGKSADPAPPETDSVHLQKKQSGSQIKGAAPTKPPDQKPAPAASTKASAASQTDQHQAAVATGVFGKLFSIFSSKNDNKPSQKSAEPAHIRGVGSTPNLTVSADGQQKTPEHPAGKSGRTSSSGSVSDLHANKARTSSTGSVGEQQQARATDTIFDMDGDTSKNNPSTRPP